LLFLSSSLLFLSQAICLSISKVPLNAKINHCHHEGCHGESVAPDPGLGEVSEEAEILLIVKTRRAQGVGNRESGVGWMERTINGVESLEK
jgi:hypothetical protein